MLLLLLLDVRCGCSVLIDNLVHNVSSLRNGIVVRLLYDNAVRMQTEQLIDVGLIGNYATISTARNHFRAWRCRRRQHIPRVNHLGSVCRCQNLLPPGLNYVSTIQYHSRLHIVLRVDQEAGICI